MNSFSDQIRTSIRSYEGLLCLLWWVMGSPGKMNQSDPEQSANQSLRLVWLISVISPHCWRCGFSIITSLPPSVLFIAPSLLSLTFTSLLTFSLVFDSHFPYLFLCLCTSFSFTEFPSRFAIHLSRALHVRCVPSPGLWRSTADPATPTRSSDWPSPAATASEYRPSVTPGRVLSPTHTPSAPPSLYPLPSKVKQPRNHLCVTSF